MSAVAAIPSERDVYANLLRDSRGLRRDQASARDSWFAQLPWEKKEQTLFELEMLLKGVACFGNPRNHPGAPRATAAVAHDFREELRILRDGLSRANTLVRSLLGDREKAYTFSRYLETVLPEDSARGQLLQEQLTQDTPQESLFVLRNSFDAYQDLTDGLMRLDHVGNRMYTALHGTVSREIGRNVFFNPLMALEFRQEFDRIRSGEVLEALHEVRSEAAHRVVALTMLSLFRALRYLDLVDRYAADASSARRSYLILAVLRSDLRALTRYLARNAADAIANGLERELMAVDALEIAERRDALQREVLWMATLRSALETVANSLRVEVRKTFLRDLPRPSAGVLGVELGPQLVVSAAALRASVHHAITSVCRVLAPSHPPPRLALDGASRRAESERLRREVWMFMQILRAFIAKAQAAEGSSDRWAGASSFQFVRDFLSHFRAIGYQLVRSNDYEHLDPFLAALDQLRDVDLLQTDRLRAAVSECHRFYEFLEELFREISQRSELKRVTFDRKDATETLKIYLGRG
ncbi:MAG TPA: hypothetical protein RMH99_11950 [Sandaracinaceae bacterium LLY-WYZ-13_1]|nr:hypothetical protein [Sandaracinaceae bacterium LLY-WYZ-13_1]